MRRRPHTATLIALAVAAAVVVTIVVVSVRSRDGEDRAGTGPGTTTDATAPGAVTATTATAGPSPPIAPGVPPMPAWADVPGGPPPFEVPPGGDANVTREPGGRRVSIASDDGTPLAEARVDPDGVYRSVRYYDRRGDVTLVVDRIDAGPARVTGSMARGGGCRDSRAAGGPTWGAFPMRWRINVRSIPRGLPRAATVLAARRARGVWASNANRCGVPDASRASFRYMGATTRPLGRNGTSSVGFGDVDAMGGVCRGALASTFTWMAGGRGIETDVRLDARPVRPYTVATPPPVRRIDVWSVVVHETGHALGFGHVGDASNVMYPRLVPGGSHRRLGLGDARANNARYR